MSINISNICSNTNHFCCHCIFCNNFFCSQGLWTTHDDMMAILRLIAAGRLNFVRMIAETHVPEECQEIYTRLINDKNFPLVQFDWRNVK